jgi:hypothetical protein
VLLFSGTGPAEKKLKIILHLTKKGVVFTGGCFYPQWDNKNPFTMPYNFFYELQLLF